MNSELRFPLRSEWEIVQSLPKRPDGSPLLAVGSVPHQDPLVCFPLKIEWEAAQPIKIDSYPAPQYTSRDEQSAAMPSVVEKLAQFARTAGWGVYPQSSMGSVPHARTGRPSGLKRLVGLRFGAHPSGRRAYAVYEAPERVETWKPRSIMIWGPDLTPYAHCSMNHFRDYLRQTVNLAEDQLKRWVAALERERVASEAFQKRRMTVRRQIVKIADEGRFKAGQAEDRQTFRLLEDEWKARVAELQEGVFTSEEVAVMIDPEKRRRTSREGL